MTIKHEPLGAQFEARLSMNGIQSRAARLRRICKQQMTLREQLELRNVVTLENGKAVGRIRERPPDTESHGERRRFRSDAQLRADRADDERRFVSSMTKH